MIQILDIIFHCIIMSTKLILTKLDINCNVKNVRVEIHYSFFWMFPSLMKKTR